MESNTKNIVVSEEVVEENIKHLVMVCVLYLRLKSLPHNPFVKKIGDSEEEQELLSLMNTYSSFLMPLIDDWFIEDGVNVENKDFTEN